MTPSSGTVEDQKRDRALLRETLGCLRSWLPLTKGDAQEGIGISITKIECRLEREDV